MQHKIHWECKNSMVSNNMLLHYALRICSKQMSFKVTVVMFYMKLNEPAEINKNYGCTEVRSI